MLIETLIVLVFKIECHPTAVASVPVSQNISSDFRRASLFSISDRYFIWSTGDWLNACLYIFHWIRFVWSRRHKLPFKRFRANKLSSNQVDYNIFGATSPHVSFNMRSLNGLAEAIHIESGIKFKLFMIIPLFFLRLLLLVKLKENINYKCWFSACRELVLKWNTSVVL